MFTSRLNSLLGRSEWGAGCGGLWALAASHASPERGHTSKHTDFSGKITSTRLRPAPPPPRPQCDARRSHSTFALLPQFQLFIYPERAVRLTSQPQIVFHYLQSFILSGPRCTHTWRELASVKWPCCAEPRRARRSRPDLVLMHPDVRDSTEFWHDVVATMWKMCHCQVGKYNLENLALCVRNTNTLCVVDSSSGEMTRRLRTRQVVGIQRWLRFWVVFNQKQ